MPAGITINSNGIGRIRETFRSYASHNRREVEFLWQDQSRKLANELYNVTAAIAPSRSEIAADVRALGWKIPTRFADGRIGRGLPGDWTGFALTKRERRKKGKPVDEAAFRAKRPTLAQMQAYVIALRSRARLFLASGWLGAIVDLGGSPKTSSGKVDRDRGGADITRSPGLITVEFWNRTPGIEGQNSKHDLVGKAVKARVADMLIYIRRKQTDALRLLKQAA